MNDFSKARKLEKTTLRLAEVLDLERMDKPPCCADQCSN